MEGTENPGTIDDKDVVDDDMMLLLPLLNATTK
jgi:hypothetical protein